MWTRHGGEGEGGRERGKKRNEKGCGKRERVCLCVGEREDEGDGHVVMDCMGRGRCPDGATGARGGGVVSLGDRPSSGVGCAL